MTQFDQENIFNILMGRGDWFTACLFRLIAKADDDNREKLRVVFPDEVEFVEQYLYGK